MLFGLKTINCTLVLLFVLFLTSPAHSSVAKNELSFKDAVVEALNKSPKYLAAKSEFEAAKLNADNAFAAFFPSLKIAANHGLRDIHPDTQALTSETRWASNAEISLSGNLYNNGETYKNYRIASRELELSKLNLSKIKAEVIQSVALAYYRHNLSVRNLNFTRRYHSELERLAQLVNNQYRQGFKTRKDYLNFKTSAQRGRLDVIRAEQEALDARTALLSVIGRSADDSVDFDETFQPILPKGRLIADFKSEDLYESRMLSLQREISELKVARAQRRFWPELNLVGTASYGSSQYLDTSTRWTDNDSTQWSVMLNLSFQILDWGIRSRNVRIEVANQSVAEQNRKSTLFEAERQLERFKLALQQSEETYRLAKELQKMEEDTFKLLERDYRSGQTTYLELTTGLSNLLNAQARGQEADFELAELYLKWKYFKRTLDEKTVLE